MNTDPKDPLKTHTWGGCQQGGCPAEADSYEWVRYCLVCGMEDTCEDPLPPCPGIPKKKCDWGMVCESMNNTDPKGKRDPRIDPRPGDVLRFGADIYSREYIEVMEPDPSLLSTDISYWQSTVGHERSRSLVQWREWAANAEVLKIAEASQ